MRALTIVLVLLLTGCGGGSDTDTSVRDRPTPPPRQEVDAGGYATRVVRAVDRSRESVRRLVGATGSWEAVLDEAERGASTMSRSVRDVERLRPPGEVAQQHRAVASGLTDMREGMERLKSAARAEDPTAADAALERMLTANAVLEGELLMMAESLDSEALRAGARSNDMPELGSLR